MTLEKVVRIGDQARGHTDILGSEVIGTVQDGSLNVKNGGIGLAHDESTVFFPSHAHALDEGTPINFRTHSEKINATGRHNVNSEKIALDGDIVPVADEAGSNATMQASSVKLNCSD